MNLSENDTVYMKDGTTGTVLYIYKYEQAASIEFKYHIQTVPISELTKEKPQDDFKD